MAEGTLPGTRPSQKTAGPGRAGRAITRPGGEDGRRITIHAGVSIVRPARGLPAGFWDGPVQSGLSDNPVRPGGPSGWTALTQAGRQASAGQR